MKTPLLISRCLLGENTKYNGKNNYVDNIELLKDKYELFLCCPEVMGGLSIPRDPSEIKNEIVISNKGKDVTNEFLLGAEKTIDIVKRNNIKLALLKDNSPSCGSTMIYDGSFSQKKIVGMGITAKKLKELGVQIFTENEIEILINM